MPACLWLIEDQACSICRGFTEYAGSPVRRAVQSQGREVTGAFTRSWAAYSVTKDLIFLMLYSVKQHHQVTDATCSVKVSLSSISSRLCWWVRSGAELDTNVVLNRTGWDQQELSLREIELKVAFHHPFWDIIYAGWDLCWDSLMGRTNGYHQQSSGKKNRVSR